MTVQPLPADLSGLLIPFVVKGGYDGPRFNDVIYFHDPRSGDRGGRAVEYDPYTDTVIIQCIRGDGEVVICPCPRGNVTGWERRPPDGSRP
jgi:hypothetical protein